MTDPIERLTCVLTEENVALAAMDLTKAAAFLMEKRDACAALSHASATVDPAAALRLNDLCAENRRLLARAMATQQRLIALVAGAMPRLGSDLRYGAGGRMTPDARPSPLAFLARA